MAVVSKPSIEQSLAHVATDIMDANKADAGQTSKSVGCRQVYVHLGALIA